MHSHSISMDQRLVLIPFMFLYIYIYIFPFYIMVCYYLKVSFKIMEIVEYESHLKWTQIHFVSILNFSDTAVKFTICFSQSTSD